MRSESHAEMLRRRVTQQLHKHTQLLHLHKPNTNTQLSLSQETQHTHTQSPDELKPVTEHDMLFNVCINMEN